MLDKSNVYCEKSWSQTDGNVKRYAVSGCDVVIDAFEWILPQNQSVQRDAQRPHLLLRTTISNAHRHCCI